LPQDGELALQAQAFSSSLELGLGCIFGFQAEGDLFLP
jgi:hypothetical protein